MDRRVSTQDLSWFLDLHRNEQLDLDPPYQRRSVWSPRDRRFFLDTIFRGYPSPSIFLHKSVRDNGSHTYEVVDGKQRLETILRFVENRISLAQDFGDANFDGKKWRNLSDEQQRTFWDYVLPVEFIRVIDGTVVNQVFDRLNRNSRKLERQELRHAKFDGWLVTLVEAEAEQGFWKDVGVVTTARAKRMKDVQFLSELFCVLIRGSVQGFDQDGLDELYAEFEVLEDVEQDFDPDELRSSLEETKRFIGEMESANCVVTRHARTYVNFYTLWSVVALENGSILPAAEAAIRYEEMMEQVGHLKAQDDLEAFLRTQEGPTYSAAHRYLTNSTGASTEPAQRQARHDVLLEVLRPG